MRALQEAVELTPPGPSDIATDVTRAIPLVLVAATSSAEQTLLNPGWWQFYNPSTASVFIRFYNIAGVQGPAVAGDWEIPAGQTLQWYIGFDPVATSSQARRYWRALSVGGTTLKYYLSSR